MSTRNSWHTDSDSDVSCIACGSEVPRSDAREYDKHGQRFERDGKAFEYICKPCYTDYCHQPRDGLEATLVQAGAGQVDDRTFLTQYVSLVRDD